MVNLDNGIYKFNSMGEGKLKGNKKRIKKRKMPISIRLGPNATIKCVFEDILLNNIRSIDETNIKVSRLRIKNSKIFLLVILFVFFVLSKVPLILELSHFGHRPHQENMKLI